MTRLRAVQPDETAPEPKKPKSVVEAAKAGTQRELLAAMRDRIAVTVGNPDTPPRDLASLTKRLQEIVKEIAALDALNSESGSSANDTGSTDDTFDASAI